MKILSVSYENAMASAPTTIAFPRTGIVLVTGPNGHGKSTGVEAVSAALYGEITLEELVTHVLVHEIGHHMGLSDADIDAIEASAG